VHAAAAERLLPARATALAAKGVTLHCCARSLPLVAGLANALPATDEDWAAEYHTLDLAIRVVDD
jgi:glutamate-5-semialdehyde dehydrogenase